MRHLSFWILNCLLGWTALQAADASLSEANCRPKLVDLLLKDEPVPFESIFAFVYNNNAGRKNNIRDATNGYRTSNLRNTNGYRTSNPVTFNSKGPFAKIIYDGATGELVIPLTGHYEITYSIASASSNFRANISIKSMAIAVNGKKIAKSEQFLSLDDVTTATIALPLAKGDRVSLVLPNASNPLLSLNGQVGNSASLFIKKL
jgi:hypothetical protein